MCRSRCACINRRKGNASATHMPASRGREDELKFCTMQARCSCTSKANTHPHTGERAVINGAGHCLGGRLLNLQQPVVVVVVENHHLGRTTHAKWQSVRAAHGTVFGERRHVTLPHHLRLHVKTAYHTGVSPQGCMPARGETLILLNHRLHASRSTHRCCVAHVKSNQIVEHLVAEGDLARRHQRLHICEAFCFFYSVGHAAHLAAI